MKNLRIIYVLFVFFALFISLTLYLTYIEIFNADTYLSANNTRNASFTSNVLRGKITDINGTVISESNTYAYSFKEPKPGSAAPLTTLSQKRIYNKPEFYRDITGVYYNVYTEPDGINPFATKLEEIYNKHLMSAHFTDDIVKRTNSAKHKYSHTYTLPNGKEKTLSGTITEGNTLKLTFDHRLQEYAYSLLEQHKGKNASIVMSDPNTGAILAMAYVTDKNTNVFLPTDNKSAPGSVFKVISAASIIENGYSGIHKDGMNLDTAFIKSKNEYFMEMFKDYGYNKLYETAKKFMFNTPVHLEHRIIKSTINENSSNYQEAMGQGSITSSPLGMCLVANTIANNGKMMQPYIVDSIVSSDGKITLYSTTPQVLSECIKESTANKIKDLMYQVLNNPEGTAYLAARALNYKDICGKTGTVQREVAGKIKNDAWFIAFAPKDNPKVSVSVMVWDVSVHTETGATVGVPIAGKMIEKYMELYK